MYWKKMLENTNVLYLATCEKHVLNCVPQVLELPMISLKLITASGRRTPWGPKRVPGVTCGHYWLVGMAKLVDNGE